jgi:hypothetical protein
MVPIFPTPSMQNATLHVTHWPSFPRRSFKPGVTSLRSTILPILPSSRTPFLLQPLIPQKQSPLPQPLQFTPYLLLLKRNPIRLLWLRPEIRHREAIIEIRPVVVHYCYRKHDVHAELGVMLELRPFFGVIIETDFEDFEIGSSHCETSR